MESSARVEMPGRGVPDLERSGSRSVCDEVERLRDVSRLILDAIERDDLPAMQRHVTESEHLIALIGDGLAARRGESAGDSRNILDHIRRMNAGMLDRLRSRQTEILDEIGRARA